MQLDPQDIPVGADTGAETQRRFRYQAEYLAILSLELLRPDSEFQALWCEHGDDGLVLRSDGKYVAYQVKTKAIGQPAIKAIDGEAISAIRTFAALELEAGQRIGSYVLVSSIGFSTAHKDGSNLPHVLESVAGQENQELVNKYVQRIGGELDLQEGVVRAVLKKMRCEIGPSITDISHRLTDRVAGLGEMADQNIATCRRTATAIADVLQKASQLEYEAERSEVIAFMEDPTSLRLTERARGKRVGVERLRAVVAQQRAESLEAPLVLAVVGLPPSSSKAEKKMLAGGLPMPLVQNLVNLRGAYEAEMLRRSERLGIEEARRQAAHIELSVTTDGTAAHAILERREGQAFGSRMYADVESRVRRRAESLPGHASSLGLSFEQLMGAMTAVTDQCRVWWTDNLSFLDKDGE